MYFHKAQTLGASLSDRTSVCHNGAIGDTDTVTINGELVPFDSAQLPTRSVPFGSEIDDAVWLGTRLHAVELVGTPPRHAL